MRVRASRPEWFWTCEMSSMRPSLWASTIFSMSADCETWKGISSMMITSRPADFSWRTQPRTTMRPRPEA